MAGSREELEELRRLDELERRAGPAAPAPVVRPKRSQQELHDEGVKAFMADERKYQDEMLRRAKNEGWGTGVPKLAYDIGGRITDATGSPGLGYIANIATEAIPALAGSFSIPGAREASMLQKPAESLMKRAMKPSPSEDSAKVAAALRTALDKGLNPSYGGLEKKAALVRSLNAPIEEGIARSGATVDTRQIADSAADAMRNFKSGPKATQAVDDIGKVQEEFLAHPQVEGAREIPVQLAHQLKQGYQKHIGDVGYDQLKLPTTEGEKQIARALRLAVAEKVPAVQQPLAEQAALNNWERIVGSAAGRNSNKDVIGFSAAAAPDNAVMAASILERHGMPWLARALYTAGKPSVALPLGITADQKMQTDRQIMAEYLRQRAAEQGAQ